MQIKDRKCTWTIEKASL